MFCFSKTFIYYLTAPGFVVAHGIFSWHMWDLAPWQRIKPGPPALGVQCLSHWTSRLNLWNMFFLKKKKVERQPRADISAPQGNQEWRFLSITLFCHSQPWFPFSEWLHVAWSLRELQSSYPFLKQQARKGQKANLASKVLPWCSSQQFYKSACI